MLSVSLKIAPVCQSLPKKSHPQLTKRDTRASGTKRKIGSTWSCPPRGAFAFEAGKRMMEVGDTANVRQSYDLAWFERSLQ
jgi:hypothetical protein